MRSLAAPDPEQIHHCLVPKTEAAAAGRAFSKVVANDAAVPAVAAASCVQSAVLDQGPESALDRVADRSAFEIGHC